MKFTPRLRAARGIGVGRIVQVALQAAEETLPHALVGRAVVQIERVDAFAVRVLIAGRIAVAAKRLRQVPDSAQRHGAVAGRLGGRAVGQEPAVDRLVETVQAEPHQFRMADAHADQRGGRAVADGLVVDLLVADQQDRAFQQQVALDLAPVGVAVDRPAVGVLGGARQIVGLDHLPHEPGFHAHAARAARAPVAGVQPAVGLGWAAGTVPVRAAC